MNKFIRSTQKTQSLRKLDGHFTCTVFRARKSLSRSPIYFLISSVLAYVVCTPIATGQLSPPPVGGYYNLNTAVGEDPLYNMDISSGSANTAVGWHTLYYSPVSYRNTAIGSAAMESDDLGSENTAVGVNALHKNTEGSDNAAVGEAALANNLTGLGNTAIGFYALAFSTTASNNTATGNFALENNLGGSGNTADGSNSLASNTSGSNDSAVGFQSLYSNVGGNDNTASGYEALHANTSGYQNTATGSLALSSNIDGYNNTADGQTALQSNQHGLDNTATGVAALRDNTTGNYCAAFGLSALTSNNNGSSNTALGTSALYYNVAGNFNTAAGTNALQHATGDSNIAIGYNAGFNVGSGGNNIEIGHKGMTADNKVIRIGNPTVQNKTFIAGIYSATSSGGAPVYVNLSGQLGTLTSSARFKEAIKPMAEQSEAILALQPVTFRYKKQIDAGKTPQFGLVAEQVEKVNPDLVIRDEQGKPYTVRYEAVNAMLLNEFLKEHGKVQEQGHRIAAQDGTISQLKETAAKQQNEIEVLVATLKDQAAQIRKVSDQVAIQGPALRVVSAAK